MRVAFILEQQVGHRTYSQNLRRWVESQSDIKSEWVPITYVRDGGWIERMTVLPAGLRGTLRGRQQVRRALAQSSADAVLFFTQVPAALAGRRLRRRPYVIVVDDTPVLFDKMSSHYGKAPDRRSPWARWKHRVNAGTLQRAAAVLPFSSWARKSLIDDYGVRPDRIHVVPSGVDLQRWQPAQATDDGDTAPLRILFVGGDFERKGGPTLVAACQLLRPGSYELHLVTKSSVAVPEGAIVYSDMEPNSDRLRDLFRSCHVLVLPTWADASPHVVIEAAASGLPAIVSNVGAVPEMVVPGETGFVIEAGDEKRIAALLTQLIDDAAARRQMGVDARARAQTNYSAATNAALTVAHLRAAIERA